MSAAFPLDLQARQYTYVERPNSVILDLLDEHVVALNRAALVVDVGCGAGATARAGKRRFPAVRWQGVEPNAQAAALAAEACDDVFPGTLEAFLQRQHAAPFDAVVLGDVLEHIADPVAFLRALVEAPALRQSVLIISVPNVAVWYSRVLTLLGRFDYGWSGLWDRTHLRFYTRASIRRLLGHCGLAVVADRATPSLVQSAAPVLRELFEADVAQGEHLTLTESQAFRAYRRWVEPWETSVCNVWPELLGFQIVTVARRA